MTGTTLTTPGGPTVLSEKTLRALLAIRKIHLLPGIFQRVAMARSTFDAVASDHADLAARTGDWLIVHDDAIDQSLPDRVAMACASEAATLGLALALGASNVLIDGPIKESAKFAAIKCEGTVSILVRGYRMGLLSSVKPMTKALASLGHQDVLPPPDQLDTLWRSLEQLG